MTNEQRQEHIRVVNQAIQVLNKQIVNLMYTQARMADSQGFLLRSDDDAIRLHRRTLDDDLFVAKQIIETDEIK